MTLLKKEPLAAVHSLAELFAIAFSLEEEAATRYRELAIKMRAHGESQTAAVFEHLADEERGHCKQVDQWSHRLTGQAPKVAELQWELPETFDDEAAGELAGSRLATPYRALSMAVRNEERAFAFWSYVAAQAGDAAVRDAAETMAREELEHVALLRRERRRAYHAHQASPERTAPRPTSGKDILAATASLEDHFANQLVSFSHEAVNDRGLIEEMAKTSRQMAAETATSNAEPGHAGQETYPTNLMQTAEMLVERYLEAADHATDEGTLMRAQSLARTAIERLTTLRTVEALSRR